MIQAGYRYGLSLTHHHYDAEDLVQQAWMKCLHRYGKVENRSLLFTTIRNLFYDQCRRGNIIVFESMEADPARAESLPEREAAPIHASGDLDLLLSTLRVEEREALFLNAVEGYTAREISEMTGSPRGTILSHLHRARQKLTRSLKDESNPSKPSPRPGEHRHE